MKIYTFYSVLIVVFVLILFSFDTKSVSAQSATAEAICGEGNVIYTPVDLRNYVVGPPGHTHTLSTGEVITYEGSAPGPVKMNKNSNYEQFIITGNDINRREDTSWAPLPGFVEAHCENGDEAAYTLDPGCSDYTGGGSPSADGATWIPGANSKATGNNWGTQSHQIVTINEPAARAGNLQYCALNPSEGLANVYSHPNACGQTNQLELTAVCKPQSFTFCTGEKNTENLAIIEVKSGPGTGDRFYYMENWGLVGFEAPGFQAGLGSGGSCGTGDPGTPGACPYWPWTPFCDNVSTPQLYCACSGDDCDPFEDSGFVSPNDVDIGQDDGTGKGLFRVFDRDTETYYDIPPVLFSTSPGMNACGAPAPPPPPGGGGGGSGGGTCNPFNCFGPGVIDFATSLECAANALKANLDEPTWFWFDRYGPYCHNETFSIPVGTPVADGGKPYILPFGFNYWSFYDTYLPPGSAGGRTCGEQPPSKAQIEASATHYPADIGMACPAQGDPIREPGHPAFDYYRGPLDRCPLPEPKTHYAAGSFGLDPQALAAKLIADGVNYQGRQLSGANPAELLQLLEIAKLMDINPFILLGIWATESWFGQNGGCSGGGGTPGCNVTTITPSSCVFQGGSNVSATSYNGSTETGHGSNEYWGIVGNACSFNIPTETMVRMANVVNGGLGSKGPTANVDAGNNNVCRNEDPQLLSPWYGYAADFTTPGCKSVFMPTLEGVSSWEKSGGFPTNDGNAVIMTGVNGNIIYKMLILHLGYIVPSTRLLAGQKVADLYDWGTRTHAHFEILRSVDGGASYEFIRPENSICR